MKTLTPQERERIHQIAVRAVERGLLPAGVAADEAELEFMRANSMAVWNELVVVMQAKRIAASAAKSLAPQQS